MARRPLSRQRLCHFLSPEEEALLERCAALPPESLYDLLEASPSLAGRGVRRPMLMSLVEPLLSPGFRSLTTARAALGASAGRLTVWPRTRSELPAGVSATAPLQRVDLLKGLPLSDWLVRNQVERPTCVAEAGAACIELLLTLAQAPPRTFTLLSPRFLDDRLRARRLSPAPGFDTIPPSTRLAKLGEAARILEAEGLCERTRWPDAVPPAGTSPDPAALDDASRRRAHTAFYLDQPPGSARMPGLARRVHAELAARRPVAVALPGFRDAALGAGDTSWTRPGTWSTGIVLDKGETDVMVDESGHAVCLVGFQPDASERHGGYFVFRNSWGFEFGRKASEPDRPKGPPRVPLPGYGTMSASYVEDACWEAVSFALQEPTP